MKMKVLAILVLLAVPVMAQPPDASKDANQLRDLANAAKSKGDLQKEADYFCQAAALDPKKYDKKCARAKADAAKMLEQFQAYLSTGRFELQHKDYQGALRDLGKITFGPAKDEALDLMRQAREGLNAPSLDQASLAALRTAQAEYARGDFDAAEADAKKVGSPVLLSAAHEMITNIDVYRSTMSQADALALQGDFRDAAQKYQFAALIKADGPGHPADKVQQMQAAAAQAEQLKAQAEQLKASAQIQAPSSPSAHKASSSKSKRVKAVAAQQENPPALEDTLTQGIAAYYASHFTQADEALSSYLQANAAAYPGAAHFYLGASLLSQAILLDPGDAARGDDMRKQALQEFALAKQSNYEPLRSAVSPRILTQWTQTGTHP